MTLDKEEFLKTELGRELKRMITRWDQVLTDDSHTEKNIQVFLRCQAQWDVYRMAIRHCYGMDCQLIRTDEYFGLCTKDKSDWLMKVDRELASQRIPARERGFDDHTGIREEVDQRQWLFDLAHDGLTEQEILRGFTKFYVLKGKGLNNVYGQLFVGYSDGCIYKAMQRLETVLQFAAEGKELNGKKEAE